MQLKIFRYKYSVLFDVFEHDSRKRFNFLAMTFSSRRYRRKNYDNYKNKF
jgi:hypothetical protein